MFTDILTTSNYAKPVESNKEMLCIFYSNKTIKEDEFYFSLAFYWENHNHLLSIVQLTTVNSSYGFIYLQPYHHHHHHHHHHQQWH